MGSASKWSAVFAIGGAKLVGKGLYASETPSETVSHEASIIAKIATAVQTTAAIMRVVEYFIPVRFISFCHCGMENKTNRVRPYENVSPYPQHRFRDNSVLWVRVTYDF